MSIASVPTQQRVPTQIGHVIGLDYPITEDLFRVMSQGEFSNDLPEVQPDEEIFQGDSMLYLEKVHIELLRVYWQEIDSLLANYREVTGEQLSPNDKEVQSLNSLLTKVARAKISLATLLSARLQITTATIVGIRKGFKVVKVPPKVEQLQNFEFVLLP